MWIAKLTGFHILKIRNIPGILPYTVHLHFGGRSTILRRNGFID